MSKKISKQKEESYINSGTSALSNRAFTIPNILCLIRILLLTPFVNFFLDKDYIWAGIILVLSGLTDCLDGFIARHFNQESELGKILDPLADKLTLLAVGVCLCFIQPFIIPVVAILVLKDLLMLVGSSKVVKMGVLVPKSKWYGKLGTIMFYLSSMFIVFVEIMHSMDNPLVVISDTLGRNVSLVLLSLTAIIMIYAFIRYSITYRDIVAKAQKCQEKSASIIKD